MATCLSIPPTGLRVAPAPFAWTLVHYPRIGREKLHVRYLNVDGLPRTAALDSWLDYDDQAKPHSARIAWFPPDMDEEIRDLLLADLFAHYTGESTDWEMAGTAQLEKAVLL